MLTHPALDADAGAIVALAVLQAARVALSQLAAAPRPALLAVAAALLAAAPLAAVELALGCAHTAAAPKPSTGLQSRVGSFALTSAAVVAGPLFEADARLALQVVHAVLGAVRQAAAEPLVGLATVGAAPARPAPAAPLDAHPTGAALRVRAVGSLAVLAAEARLAGTAAAEAATAARAVGPFAEVVANGALGALPAGLAAAAALHEAPVAPAEHGAHAVCAVEADVAREAVALAQPAAAVAVALARAAGGHVPCEAAQLSGLSLLSGRRRHSRATLGWKASDTGCESSLMSDRYQVPGSRKWMRSTSSSCERGFCVQRHCRAYILTKWLND